MADEMEDRLAALSPDQRRLLATRLTAENSSPTSGRLVACILGQDGQRIIVDELRGYAKDRLPDYMIPQLFAVMDDLPRTSGGKIDRKDLQTRDWRSVTGQQDEGDDSLDYVAPRNEIEQTLADIWVQVLGIEDISVQDNFFEVGGDSLLTIRILARAGKAGLTISPESFFNYPTIAEQALLKDIAPKIVAEKGVVTGVAPITPIQHWFFERITVDQHHWNQSLLFRVARDMDFMSLERAVQKLLLHHDALRLNFIQDDAGCWRQHFSDLAADIPLTMVDVSDHTDDDLDALIEEVATDLNTGFDLASGSLLRLALFQTAPGTPNRLLVVAHHLIVDAVSWGILLEDLATLWEQFAQNEATGLPAKTTSMKMWAARLRDHARQDEMDLQQSYWVRTLQNPHEPIPIDFSAEPSENKEETAQTLSFVLSASETDLLLHEVPQVFHSQVNDVLLSAFATSVIKWTGASSLQVDIEGHGREALFDDFDISRTIGWFTTVFPVRLTSGAMIDPAQTLAAIKEQSRAIPNKGIGYGMLRELAMASDAQSVLKNAPLSQICFNYLGQVDQRGDAPDLLVLDSAKCGQARSPDGNRAYLLEVNVLVSNGQLQAEWTYSDRFHKRETVEALGRAFIAVLQSLTRKCGEGETRSLTPSDFPLAGLNREGLDEIAGILAGLDDE